MKKILFRCDSSASIGLGHVKRCLLLAQRINLADSSFEIFFATQDLVGNINKEIVSNGFENLKLSSNTTLELIDIIQSIEPLLVILDSYDIDYVMEKEILEATKCQMLCFDDLLSKHDAQMVLNHGIHITRNQYENLVSNKTKVLCGSQYTLLRDEFFEVYENSVVKKSVALFFGGNDVMNLSHAIGEILFKIDNEYKITIITSSVNPNLQTLKKVKNIEFLIDITDIAKKLSTKEFIITASGGTLFEVMALKKKFINIQVAQNQKGVVDFLEHKKISTSILMHDISEEVLRNKIQYIEKNSIYDKLDLQFSKTKLVEDILDKLSENKE